jgi:hypothetical protein
VGTDFIIRSLCIEGEREIAFTVPEIIAIETENVKHVEAHFLSVAQLFFAKILKKSNKA